jgi:hypothetical protein
MDASLANYEYRYKNAQWLYQLFPDRVVATGHDAGNRHHEQVFELQRYFQHPNRSSRISVTKRAWIAWLAATMALLIGVASSLALIGWLDDMVVAFVLGSIAVSVVVFFVAMHRGAERILLTTAHFKQHDNKDSFVVWQIADEQKDEFAAFVDKVQKSIGALDQAR